MKQLLLVAICICLLLSCKTDSALLSDTQKRFCTTSNPVNDTLVLLVMGQSNAANAGEKLYTSHCNNTFNFFKEHYSFLPTL